MAETYFIPAGPDRFVATPATGGPWDPSLQHGGPPSALLARIIERHDPRPGSLIGRIAIDFLAPVPVAELTSSVSTLRDGRNVQLIEATLYAEGRPVLRATAWRLRRAEQPELTDIGNAPPPPLPAESVELPLGLDFPYVRSIEWRVAAGRADAPGPATLWSRARIPLVPGEEPSGIERALLAGDSGSGISSVLDWNRWVFINVDLTVHLVRPPEGEWICLDSQTQIDPGGTGTAMTTLYDLKGRCGTLAQALLVSPRE